MSNGVNFRTMAVGLRAELTAAQSELAALREELATVRRGKENADLALTTQTKNKERYKHRAIAAEQRNAEREDLLNQCMHAFNHVVGFSDQATRTAWYAYFLKPVSGAIMIHLSECAKPTESGASGSTCNQIREETGLPLNRPCIACNNGACIDR